MMRLCFSFMFVLGLALTTVGCGGGGNTVVEDTRSPAEIEQQMKDYDKQMQDSAKSATNS